MPDNPFLDGRPKAGKVTVEMLEELAASLNRSNFVRDSGRPYYVRRTFNGEKWTHELDRKA